MVRNGVWVHENKKEDEDEEGERGCQ